MLDFQYFLNFFVDFVKSITPIVFLVSMVNWGFSVIVKWATGGFKNNV